MTEQTESTVHQTNGAATYFRPEDIQKMFGIKKVAYYNRLKYLRIEATKDEQGKPYLDLEQLELLKALHEHINETGKMEGFTNSALIKANNSKLSQSTEEIYTEPEDPISQFDLNKLVRSAAELKAREIAMPALVKRAIADRMDEDDLPNDLKEKVELTREAANPKYTPAEVAETMLTAWRSVSGGD